MVSVGHVCLHPLTGCGECLQTPRCLLMLTTPFVWTRWPPQTPPSSSTSPNLPVRGAQPTNYCRPSTRCECGTVCCV